MPPNLAAILVYLGFVADVDFDVSFVNGATQLVWYSASPQPTLEQINAVTQAQIDAAILAKLRAAAKQYHLSNQAENRALRATVKILVDELNILRQWMTDMKAATAASTNYATLKSGIGTLPATPQRTYAQAKTAIETLIDGES